MIYKTIFCLLTPLLALQAQNRIGTGKVQELYQQHCLSCHGENLRGGMGTALIGVDWKQVGKTLTFAEFVKKGNAAMGMPAFEGSLDDKQIRSLEIFITEKQQMAEREGLPDAAPADGVYQAGEYKFQIETVLDEINFPWSMTFLPKGGFLFTERAGVLFHVLDGVKTEVSGTPKVWQKGQGGLLDVALHPEFVKNGWVYLVYSDNATKQEGMTKIARGRIKDFEWVDEEVLFEVPAEYHRKAGVHFGSRLVIQDGYLYFSIGDRGAQDDAQDLTKPNGKIHRIHDDGRVPTDNPFVDVEGAYRTIWTYGNRNPQGLAQHPQTGAIWASEHGPRGGDEINLIEGSLNYGWPVITYGMNYGGTPITDKTEAPGMEQPKHYWTPSIAVCGIDFYDGDVFPGWKHNLFAGGLASQELHRLVIEDGQVMSKEIVLSKAGRVRDVVSGPDGHLYLVFNKPDRIVRLQPVK